jgi:hypothetical protein
MFLAGNTKLNSDIFVVSVSFHFRILGHLTNKYPDVDKIFLESMFQAPYTLYYVVDRNKQTAMRGVMQARIRGFKRTEIFRDAQAWVWFGRSAKSPCRNFCPRYSASKSILNPPFNAVRRGLKPETWPISRINMKMNAIVVMWTWARILCGRMDFPCRAVPGTTGRDIRNFFLTRKWDFL